jgi:hypothetical protein
MKRRVTTVRTLKQARAYVLQVRICGIFSDGGVGMPNLRDLPHRQPGEKGWGQKVVAIWRWKNELPAVYPEEIFYGKIPTGHAVLMNMDHLRAEHYPKHYRPLSECSPLAQRIYERLELDPHHGFVAKGIKHDTASGAESVRPGAPGAPGHLKHRAPQQFGRRERHLGPVQRSVSGRGTRGLTAQTRRRGDSAETAGLKEVALHVDDRQWAGTKS